MQHFASAFKLWLVKVFIFSQLKRVIKGIHRIREFCIRANKVFNFLKVGFWKVLHFHWNFSLPSWLEWSYFGDQWFPIDVQSCQNVKLLVNVEFIVVMCYLLRQKLLACTKFLDGLVKHHDQNDKKHEIGYQPIGSQISIIPLHRLTFESAEFELCETEETQSIPEEVQVFLQLCKQLLEVSFTLLFLTVRIFIFSLLFHIKNDDFAFFNQISIFTIKINQRCMIFWYNLENFK